MPQSRLHAIDGGASGPHAKDEGTNAATPERAASAQDRRIASRIVRRALASRDVSLAEVGLVAGVSQQRANRLLDEEHGAPMHLLVGLARRGGARGRDVVAGVADQLHALADGQACPAATGDVVADVAALSRELGEFAAAALSSEADPARLRKELVDLLDATRAALRRLDGEAA